jgi:hypothetical protein
MLAEAIGDLDGGQPRTVTTARTKDRDESLRPAAVCWPCLAHLTARQGDLLLATVMMLLPSSGPNVSCTTPDLAAYGGVRRRPPVRPKAWYAA